MAGSTDRPIEKKEEDILGVGNYINGLSSFIKSCETPITIAIQGDWGSGKTSFMNMIRHELGNDVISIWFNTWQFSQFNLGDILTINLLSALVDKLSSNKNDASQLKAVISRLKTVAFKFGNAYLSEKVGVDIKGAINDDSDEDLVKIITKLKGEFQKCVDGSLKNSGKERLVIFIDDLDRLPPQRAVEVLEILKLFLDCDNCVFVLAIDYAVVCHGISMKYGEDLDPQKGRSFFDKIIQVPFKMPIAHYEINKYIEKTLQAMNFDTQQLNTYVQLITGSIGYNPRGMKRLLNSFSLIKMVYDDFDLNDSRKQVILFAVLCLQMSYESLYNAMVRDTDNVFTPDLFNALTEAESSGNDDGSINVFDDLLERLDLDQEKEDIKIFMSYFSRALTDGNSVIQEDCNILDSILSISGTTASASGRETFDNGVTGKGIRYVHTHDPEFSYHDIGEPVEKTNKPAGWNNCFLEGYRLWGESFKESKFTQLTVDVLAALYSKDPERFSEIRNNADDYKLYSLFYGSRKQNKLTVSRKIPGSPYEIETKNAYNDKVKFLRLILEAMNFKPSDLSLNVKLARRISEES